MPEIRLKRGRERSLLRRHPWIFSGAVQSVSGDPGPGETVEILSADGTVLDEVCGDWGPRTVRCEGSAILVNGLSTYFRGATEHCYFPETCSPHFDKAKYLRDLGVLKSAGFNFIRCHTWCPPEPFYEACDELGIFVQTELPSVWSFEEAEAIIRRIRRHPCAAILCEGNEKIIDERALERLRKLAVIEWKLPDEFELDPAISDQADQAEQAGESVEVFRFFSDGGASGAMQFELHYKNLRKVFRISPLTGLLTQAETEETP